MVKPEKSTDKLDLAGAKKMVDFVENTRSIVVDYIKYRLDSCGYVWENDGREGTVAPNRVQLAMRNLGDEFEQRFRERFEGMIRQLNVTEDNAYDTFTAIVQETFCDGVNWGRVVALFGFSGQFAVHCYERNLSHMVDNIVDWVTTYVDTNNTLKSWMASHNGWDGFLEFHDGGTELRGSNPWPSFKTICGYAAAGLGVLTLGAVFTQKS